MRPGTENSLSGWLALAAPLGLYLATLSPGVDFWDIGEMQTVPYLLGIAHPTGFPLAILGGWVFTHVVSIGEPAWRMSLLCALATSLAVRALYAFVRDVTGDARAALASALAFAVGDVVWQHAVRAEVHDLALAALAVALATAARAARTRDARTLAWAALAYGCGLAIHPIVALALPCAVVFAWPALAAANVPGRLRAIGCALGPLLLYAYVPLRSVFVESHGGDPGAELGLRGSAIFDNGAPSTPEAFVRYVTGDAFSPLGAFARAASPQGLARTATFARDIAYRNDGDVLLALALVGCIVLVVKFPRLGIGLTTVPLVTLAFGANYPPESDLARYALPALWAIGAWAGIGAWWLATAIVGGGPARRTFASTAAALALGIALVPTIVPAARDVGRSVRADDARSLGVAVAQLTANGSLVVASWNYATPLAYDLYVAHTLGTRRLACGWPYDFAGHYGAWHARYRHVYFVLARAYDVTPFARPIFSDGPWQLSELRS